ncbi:hypothetical protein GCM10009639_43640 [Kitasatospora putterlickiae]|uniref:Uncharacterized protein n=1 Tax=Kitasatospora putterlickiae TaxID=221725 RepID=A0ABP4IYX1_9ACTN
MRPVRIALSAATAVAALGTLAAASVVTRSADPPHPPPVAATAARVGTGPEDRLTEADQLLLSRAEQLLIKECMGGHGLPYWVEPAVDPEELRPLGYVLDDVRWAGTHGYGSRITARDDLARANNPNAAHQRGLTDEERAEYTAALSGGPDTPVLSAQLPGDAGTVRSRLGGCEAEAQRRLYGPRETWFKVEKTALNLTPLYVPRLVRDERFTEARQRWARCMGEAGHPYQEPGSARADLPRLTAGLAPDEAFAAEVRLAVAEAECARRSGFGSVARELEEEYRAGLRDRYGGELDTYDRLRRAAVERAREVVDRSP